jgi:hypothetical protein
MKLITYDCHAHQSRNSSKKSPSSPAAASSCDVPVATLLNTSWGPSEPKQETLSSMQEDVVYLSYSEDMKTTISSLEGAGSSVRSWRTFRLPRSRLLYYHARKHVEKGWEKVGKRIFHPLSTKRERHTQRELQSHSSCLELRIVGMS